MFPIQNADLDRSRTAKNCSGTWSWALVVGPKACSHAKNARSEPSATHIQRTRRQCCYGSLRQTRNGRPSTATHVLAALLGPADAVYERACTQSGQCESCPMQSLLALDVRWLIGMMPSLRVFLGKLWFAFRNAVIHIIGQLGAETHPIELSGRLFALYSAIQVTDRFCLLELYAVLSALSRYTYL